MPDLTYTLELAGNADPAGAVRTQAQTTAAFVDQHGGYVQADHTPAPATAPTGAGAGVRAALNIIKHLHFVSIWDSNGRTIAGYNRSLQTDADSHTWQVTLINPADPDDETTLTVPNAKLYASIIDVLQRQPALKAGLDRVTREVQARKLEARAAQLRLINTTAGA